MMSMMSLVSRPYPYSPTPQHISGTYNDAHNLPPPPNTSWGPRMMPIMSLAHKAPGLSIQDHQLHLWGPMSTPTASPASNHKLNTSTTTLLPPPHPMTMPTAPPHLNAKETYPSPKHVGIPLPMQYTTLALPLLPMLV